MDTLDIRLQIWPQNGSCIICDSLHGVYESVRVEAEEIGNCLPLLSILMMTNNTF